MRARQARLLARHQAAVLPGVVAAALVAVLLALWAPAGVPPIARWPGWAAAALAVGAVSLLEDPAPQLATASPAPLPLRRGVALALGLPVLAVAWLAVDAAALTAHVGALVAITMAAGAALARRGHDERTAMLVPLVLTTACALLGTPAAALALALLAAGSLALAWASRDQ